MKILYLDCGMGAAGDMLTAALFELQDDRQSALDGLNALGLPGVLFEAEEAVRCGITGTHMKVLVNGAEEIVDEEGSHGHGHGHEHNHEHSNGHDHGHAHDHEHSHDHEHAHHHYALTDILEIISRLSVSVRVKEGVEAVYRRIAEAESHVHGQPVEEVHFHEVGAMDAVADVTAALWLFERLGVERTVCSPVRTGFGEVRCAHGILPVPAPATALLLEDMPVYAGDIRGEMCTPTGAALLGYLTDEYGTFPEMKLLKTGYGMGKKDFPRANCLCARIGMTDPHPADRVVELVCNLDDMTGEDLAGAQAALLREGALDVWTVPAFMKKGRPGVEFHVLAREEDRDTAVRGIFRHTSTIGIREAVMNRFVLARREESVETEYGPVRKKISEGYGIIREKYEYDDLARIALETGMTLQEVRTAVSHKADPVSNQPHGFFWRRQRR